MSSSNVKSRASSTNVEPHRTQGSLSDIEEDDNKKTGKGKGWGKNSSTHTAGKAISNM